MLPLRLCVSVVCSTVIGVAMIFATGCVGAGENGTGHKDNRVPLIRIERFAACRVCPAYEISIYVDREVKYVGNSSVNNIGERSGRISKAQLDELIKEFERIRFM